MATAHLPRRKIEPAPLRLGPDDAGRLLTKREFAAASYEEPFTYERVQGRLVVMAPAGSEHRGASRPFRRELGLYWGTHPKLIDDVDVEGWVATSEDDDRIPDICVYWHGPNSKQNIPDRVPDLIFEFVSGSRADQERDYIHKRTEYCAIGVREYVIVDRFKQKVLVLSRKRSKYDERELTPGDTYRTPLLPGLAVSIAEALGDE